MDDKDAMKSSSWKINWGWLYHYAVLYILTLLSVWNILVWIKEPFESIVGPSFLLGIGVLMICAIQWIEHMWWRREVKWRLQITNRCEHASEREKARKSWELCIHNPQSLLVKDACKDTDE